MIPLTGVGDPNRCQMTNQPIVKSVPTADDIEREQAMASIVAGMDEDSRREYLDHGRIQ